MISVITILVKNWEIIAFNVGWKPLFLYSSTNCTQVGKVVQFVKLERGDGGT